VIDEIPTTAAGGSETQLLLLLRHLDRSRVLPSLVCLRGSSWLSSQGLDVPLLTYEVNARWRPRYWRRARAFARFLRDEGTDVVQTFFVDSDVFGAVGARLARRPLLVWSRRNVGHWQATAPMWLYRRLGRRVACYLANSRAAADRVVEAEGVEPSRVAVIHNGLDLSRFSGATSEARARQRAAWGLRPNDRVVGIVANLRAVKNIGSLLEAFARVARDFPDAALVSVGEGEMRPALERRRDELGLGDRVRFVGQVDDVVPCLAAFDVAALTSTHESLSNSIMEYMAAGLPTVASDVGGASELITSGETGLLYDVSDGDALAGALRALLGDPALARRLGEAARRAAFERFDPVACARAHEDLYERLVAEARAREGGPAAAPVGDREP
jgi:glycosyltransferase involved in cell wall biosynthesis